MKLAAIASIVLALTLASACTCAKKEAKAPAEPPAAEATKEVEAPAEPAPTDAEAEAEPEDAEPEESTDLKKLGRTEAAQAALELGTPTQNLNGILAAANMQLGIAKDAEQAAAMLDRVLYTYNVAELRAREKAAQEAGEEAPARVQAERKELESEYKKFEAKFAAENSPIFAQTAKAWNQIWGLD